MSCTCNFRRGGSVKPDKFSLPCPSADGESVRIGFSLSVELSRLTRGNRFFYADDDRGGDCLDVAGVTLIPPETLAALIGAARSILNGGWPVDALNEYNLNDDDGDGSLSDQLSALIGLFEDAGSRAEWVICFGV